MNERVYIVDDEWNIRYLLELGLREQGFQTRSFENGEALFQGIRECLPDVLVLDWMMPPPDGAEIITRLRRQASTRALPIVLLTARTSEGDQVRGLELGADDYVAKPFSIRGLAARLRALLRRQDYIQSNTGAVLRFEDITLDVEKRVAQIGETPMPLTTLEFDLLYALMRNKGRVLTREVLLDTVWGKRYDGNTRTVDVHIRYLRKKMEQSELVRVDTVRGLGYKLVSAREG